MGLGYDKWLDQAVEDHFGEWEGKTCDRCGANIYIDDMHNDTYYATPEGDFCFGCAYDLSYDYVRDDEPDLATESDEFEQLIDDYLNYWETSNGH